MMKSAISVVAMLLLSASTAYSEPGTATIPQTTDIDVSRPQFKEIKPLTIEEFRSLDKLNLEESTAMLERLEMMFDTAAEPDAAFLLGWREGRWFDFSYNHSQLYGTTMVRRSLLAIEQSEDGSMDLQDMPAVLLRNAQMMDSAILKDPSIFDNFDKFVPVRYVRKIREAMIDPNMKWNCHGKTKLRRSGSFVIARECDNPLYPLAEDSCAYGVYYKTISTPPEAADSHHVITNPHVKPNPLEAKTLEEGLLRIPSGNKDNDRAYINQAYAELEALFAKGGLPSKAALDGLHVGRQVIKDSEKTQGALLFGRAQSGADMPGLGLGLNMYTNVTTGKYDKMTASEASRLEEAWPQPWAEGEDGISTGATFGTAGTIRMVDGKLVAKTAAGYILFIKAPTVVAELKRD